MDEWQDLPAAAKADDWEELPSVEVKIGTPVMEDNWLGSPKQAARAAGSQALNTLAGGVMPQALSLGSALKDVTGIPTPTQTEGESERDFTLRRLLTSASRPVAAVDQFMKHPIDTSYSVLDAVKKNLAEKTQGNRDELNAIRKQSRLPALGGQIVAGLATGPKSVGQGAVLGATQGFGNSETLSQGDTSASGLIQTGLGTGLGALLGAAGMHSPGLTSTALGVGGVVGGATGFLDPKDAMTMMGLGAVGAAGSAARNMGKGRIAANQKLSQSLVDEDRKVADTLNSAVSRKGFKDAARTEKSLSSDRAAFLDDRVNEFDKTAVPLIQKNDSVSKAKVQGLLKDISERKTIDPKSVREMIRQNGLDELILTQVAEGSETYPGLDVKSAKQLLKAAGKEDLKAIDLILAKAEKAVKPASPTSDLTTKAGKTNIKTPPPPVAEENLTEAPFKWGSVEESPATVDDKTFDLMNLSEDNPVKPGYFTRNAPEHPKFSQAYDKERFPGRLDELIKAQPSFFGSLKENAVGDNKSGSLLQALLKTVLEKRNTASLKPSLAEKTLGRTGPVLQKPIRTPSVTAPREEELKKLAEWLASQRK